jgi:hypothetical protein
MLLYTNPLSKESEAQRVFAWRQMQLEKLGADAILAAETALNKNVDIREIEKLVNAGCPIATAIFIVS